jgi:hypothetical protein
MKNLKVLVIVLLAMFMFTGNSFGRDDESYGTIEMNGEIWRLYVNGVIALDKLDRKKNLTVLTDTFEIKKVDWKLLRNEDSTSTYYSIIPNSLIPLLAAYTCKVKRLDYEHSTYHTLPFIFEEKTHSEYYGCLINDKHCFVIYTIKGDKMKKMKPEKILIQIMSLYDPD